jgi:hypothetical protein
VLGLSFHKGAPALLARTCRLMVLLLSLGQGRPPVGPDGGFHASRHKELKDAKRISASWKLYQRNVPLPFKRASISIAWLAGWHASIAQRPIAWLAGARTPSRTMPAKVPAT